MPTVEKPDFSKEKIVEANGTIEKIFFACDAGMGSSVMGVSLMRDKLEKAGLPITVDHTSVKNITEEPDFIVTTNALKARVLDTIEKYDKKIPVFGMDNLLDEQRYDQLIQMLKESTDKKEILPKQEQKLKKDNHTWNQNLFPEENILLNVKVSNKVEAITMAGNLLKKQGYVQQEYIDAMIRRDEEASVYLGNHFAIPHGVAGSEKYINKSGISFLQIPDGVDFDGETAYVMVGIAGKDGEHIEILGNIAAVCTDLDNIEKLRTTQDKKEVIKIFENLN